MITLSENFHLIIDKVIIELTLSIFFIDLRVTMKMKRILFALFFATLALLSYAQKPIYTITAKSPAILYGKINEIVSQLPPHAIEAKMSVAMGLAPLGAPNFEGIDPKANIAACFFEPEDGGMLDLVVFALKTSESSLIYQLAAKDCVIKRIGDWTVFQPKVAGLEIDENMAKLAIAAAEAPQDADLSYKLLSFSPLGLSMPTDESRPNFKNMLEKELGSMCSELWLGKDMIKINFAQEIKGGSYCEKILKSLGRVDEISEAKFVSKDNFITYESPIIATQDTLSAVLEFFETYFKADKAELEKRLSPYVGMGHAALYADGDFNRVIFIKTPLTPEQYMEQYEYFPGDILKYALFPSLKSGADTKPNEIRDKSEVEIDSIKVTTFKDNSSNIYNMASVNGMLITCITFEGGASKDGKKFTSEVIKLVKADKAVENPLPAKVDDMGILTINPKEFSEKEIKEIFADFEPIVFKVNYKNSKLTAGAEIATSNIVDAIANGFEMEARKAQEQMQKAQEEANKAKESEPQPQNKPE